MPDRYLGRQIGKYRVIRLLGAGAFAWVYEAIDRDLEIPVALKILRPEFAGQEAAEMRFRREASTAAKLRHPNIVTVRDVGQVDGAAFVAMDLHPLSLARRLELVNRLPEPEVVRVGLDVAAALAIAHAGGVIHRDIKPDNILIGPNGEAVVADFGLARALSNDASLSATNQVMGTPHYFSPEQARGQEIDGRSDLYSLGVTLFRALAGRLPFEGEDWYEVAKQHVEAEPPAPSSLVPDITPAFERVLLRLLAKRPDDRFESAISLADALATLPTAPIDRGAAMTPHSASRTVVDFTPMPAARRGSTARRVGVGAAVVAVAALGWWGAAQRGLVALPSAMVRPDTSVPPAPDTTPVNSVPLADSAQGDTVSLAPAPGGTPRPGTGVPPVVPAPAARPRAEITVTAPESAAIYVDGALVGRGLWIGERAPMPLIRIQAIIPDAPVECETAKQETSFRVRPGQQYDIALPVRSCVAVPLDVRPAAEAMVEIRSLDGGKTVRTPADAGRALFLPRGRYTVSIQKPRCREYNDRDFQVPRTDGAPTRIYARLDC